MAENKFQPRVKGRPIEDDVIVFLDGKAFHGWESLSISKNLDSIANRFDLDLDDRFTEGGEPWVIKAGVEVEIRIGKERVLTGFIETNNVSFDSNQHNHTVSGRSKPGDLVDSSVDGPAEYTNLKLDELAQKLIAPFGLEVFLSVEPQTIDKFAVKPSETIFEALDRAARLQGFFWVSTRAGNIRLTKRAKFRADSELHQNVNVVSGELNIDSTRRFKKYKVIGQTSGLDEFFGKQAAEALGEATDEGITRERTLTIVAEGSVDTEKAGTRAGWEASIRKAQGFEVKLTVDGWTQETGNLWGINQVAFVNVPWLGIKRDLLISQVMHRKGANEGTTTELTLVPTDAFESNPTLDAKDDPLSDLGLT